MFAYTINTESWSMMETQNEPLKESPKRKYNKRNEPMQSLEESFRAKYPDWMLVLNEYSKAIKQPATWKTINRANLIKFTDHLTKNFAPNTANQYATRLKAVLNIYSDEIKLPADFNKLLSPRKIPSTAVYLDEEELKKLEEYEPKTEGELLVRNLFICSAYTGARYIDIIRMNKSNIQGNELVFVSQKTHKECRLPLKPIVAKYILEKPEMEISDEGYNKAIRRICRKVGINRPVKILKAGKEREMPKWDAITSHTARRSFATNLYLRGVDIYTISNLLQHSAVSLTAKYICVNIKPLNQEAMQYFK